jgi:hypothetical protein
MGHWKLGMAREDSFVSAVLDREIRSPEQDSFGHRHFAQMLRGLIESEVNQPPYSIGLLGRWGTGKSSIKELYLHNLNDDAKAEGRKKQRKERFVTITFNAWRFGGEEIKRALLRHVYIELGGDKDKLDDALFRQIERPVEEKRKWRDIIQDGVETWGWSIVQVLLVYTVVIFGIIQIGRSLNLPSHMSTAWFAGTSFVVATVPVIKFLLDNTRLPRRAAVTRVEAPAMAAEIYEDLLIAQLALFKAGKTKLKTGKHCERIVIFVDDLDRLSPDEMISGLDAIRTFMELPDKKLPEGLGVVFVISCDEDKIADALADRRQKRGSTELSGAVFSQTDAHRFLDRIFQFRMEIPPFPKRDMRTFAEGAIRAALPELDGELKKADSSVQTLIDKMIHVRVGTPRNALQIVNCFVQNWWIAKRRELDGANTERVGGLQPGAVTDNPVALGAVCALRVDFPDFYRELQPEPELLQHFSDVFIHRRSVKDKPDVIQTILEKYAVDKENSNDVRAEHRPLRQFMASVQGIRWPKSLRPILFLSQDPVSRKYGDKRFDLYQAFISGDVQGVLEELGHANDGKQLSEQEMQILGDMVEDLTSETGPKQNDAAFVLASLTDRFRKESAQILLTPLAHRLSESDELRWRLGIGNIERVISQANSKDRKTVVSRLIDELLKTEGETTFKKTSLESPSLDEAVQMADEACTLALAVHRDDRLYPSSETRLLEWLENRQVSVGSRSHTIEFARFEGWVSEHEERLLLLFGSRYTEAVATELEEKGTDALQNCDVIRRSHVVFDKLLELGEESRPELWEHVTRYGQHGDNEFVEFAGGFVLKHVTGPSRPDPNAFNDFLVAFGNRLLSPPADLNAGEQGNAFVQLVVPRKDDLKKESAEIISGLVANWGNDASLAPLAPKLIEPLSEKFPESAATILTDWTGRVLSSLPLTTVDWFAASFETFLDDAQQNQLIKQFKPIHATDNVSADQSKRYLRFMHAASETTLSLSKITTHLEAVLNQVTQCHTNPNDYLYGVFPVVPVALKYVSPSIAASTLQGIFPNTTRQPDLFGWLHSCMIDSWPEESDDMPGYNPEQLFDQAIPIIRDNPSLEHMPDGLCGVASMISGGVISSDKQRDVVDVACVLWPHHIEDAAKILKEHEFVPSPEPLADMIDGVSTDEEADFQKLSDVWMPIAKRCSVDQHVAVAVAVLEKLAHGSEGNPDRCLGIWLSHKPDVNGSIFEKLLAHKELSDEQRKRVWLQVEKTKGLSKSFYLDSVVNIASLKDCPGTVLEMLKFRNEISSQFRTKQDKFDLGTHIVTAFRASSSNEAKAQLANWLKKLDVNDAVKMFGEDEPLSQDEIALLEPEFAKSCSWKKIAANTIEE